MHPWRGDREEAVNTQAVLMIDAEPDTREGVEDLWDLAGVPGPLEIVPARRARRRRVAGRRHA